MTTSTYRSNSKYLSSVVMTSIEVLKGIVSRDGLLVAWMDRALFGDEPMIVFLTIFCFLVFNFEFYFL
jgi:hypothetical protein